MVAGLLLSAIAFTPQTVGLADPQEKKGDNKNPVVVMETSLGTMTIELYPEKAPDTVKHFLSYVNDKFYDGTIIHSVDPKSMIQGGHFQPKMVQKPTPPPRNFKHFNGLKNERGTLAMVQLRDIDNIVNVTSRFLINVVDNKDLDNNDNEVGTEVFGKVIEGLDVLDKIAKVRTASKDKFKNVPVDEIVVKSIRLLDAGGRKEPNPMGAFGGGLQPGGIRVLMQAKAWSRRR
jgi:cyclophilin family peptidyl-prolyl cis-trans isomerase